VSAYSSLAVNESSPYSTLPSTASSLGNRSPGDGEHARRRRRDASAAKNFGSAQVISRQTMRIEAVRAMIGVSTYARVIAA
jgi:hypothetical protein